MPGSCNSPVKTFEPTQFKFDNLKSGDIILRKSFGLISEIVVAQLDDTLDISHCGIIYKEPNGDFSVIHSLSRKVSDSDGIQICKLDYFLNDSKTETIRIVRFRTDTSSLIIKKALYYLTRRIPFDEKFDPKDSSAFFCSEFPIQIIKSTFNTDISCGSTKPLFSVFLNKRFFDEIDFVVNPEIKPRQ